MNLIPPDLKRCQVESRGGSFMTLGPRPMERCTRKPLWIAKERKAGKDGQRGSMSLCGTCKVALIKQLGHEHCDFQRIGEKPYPPTNVLREMFPECWRQPDKDYAESDAQQAFDRVRDSLSKFFKESAA
jgi:hypothetical protein